MKVKLNISDVINKALKIIDKSQSKLAKEYGFGVGIGFEIFAEYMKDLSERAIKIDDPIILECLLNTGILTGSKEEFEEISKRAKQCRDAEQESQKEND